MIPLFSDGEICLIDILITRAVLIVIVDDPACLQVRVYRHCSHVLETTLLQVFTDLIGQAVADRYQAIIVTLIKDSLTAGEAPDVIAETAELLPHLLIASGIVDHSLHLTRRPDHSLCVQDALYVCIVIGSDLVIIKVIEALPEDLTLL